MKKALFIGLTILFVFIIYLANMDKKVYYLSLGDKNNYSFYIVDYLKEKEKLETKDYNYSSQNDRITDIYNKIINNKKNKNKTIKNSLIKADLLTIKINIDDIYEKINDHSQNNNDIYNYIDELTKDLDKLLELIRKYCKEDIFFIGFDIKNTKINNYLNKRFKEITNKYNIIYIKNNNNIKTNIIKEIDKHLLES